MDINSIMKTSLEAIAFQKDARLFNSLTENLGALRKAARESTTSHLLGLYKKHVTSPEEVKLMKNLSDIVASATNISISLKINPSMELNAWVYFPKVNANHPLVGAFGSAATWAWKDGAAVIKKKLDTIGWVDLENSRVHGVYEKINCSVELTAGILISELSDAEVAAILIHELGHIFSYYEYMGSKIGRNLAIVGLTYHIFNGTYGETDKVRLVKGLKNAFEIKAMNVDTVVNSKTDVEAQILVINANEVTIRSEVGSDFYDAKSYEYLSDQFAARHGAAVAQVTALDKMYRKSGEIAYRSKLAHDMIQIFGLFQAIYPFFSGNVFYMAAVVFNVLMSVIINPATSTYDIPKDRFRRLKQQLITDISTELDPERKQMLVSQIDAINGIMSQMADNEELFTFIFTRIIPSHRNDMSQQQLQKDLESIGMSDLFATAARIQTL